VGVIRRGKQCMLALPQGATQPNTLGAPAHGRRR
jgi:hypothetical protein